MPLSCGSKRDRAANFSKSGANCRVFIRNNKPKISWDTIQSFLVEVFFTRQAIDENSGSYVLVSFQDCVTELHSKLVRCRFGQFFGKKIKSRKERVLLSTVNQIGPYLKGLRGWFPGRKFRNETSFFNESFKSYLQFICNSKHKSEHSFGTHFRRTWKINLRMHFIYFST